MVTHYSRSDRKLLQSAGNQTALRYVVGLLFSEDAQQVLLLYKTATCPIPALRDTWNGVGGKMRKGEFASNAMRRECREETGLDIPKWTLIDVISDNTSPTKAETYRVHVFMAQGDINAAPKLRCKMPAESARLTLNDGTAIEMETAVLTMNCEEIKVFSVEEAKQLPLSPGLLYSLESAVQYL
jgi:8-oxo-dGTP pyrophosphatase MutT (NUDIX family)